VGLVILLTGCGFRPTGGSDGGVQDLAGADLFGVDLAGVDIAMPPGDLAGGGTGPGPLGALPAGFCCNTNEECRSRSCTSTGGGPKICSDDCREDGVCTAWGAAMRCDMTSDRCVPSATPYTCLQASSYAYGGRPIGACCAHGFYKAGQECLGGLCLSTGNSANPYYCTQGCNANTPCPGGYSCFIGFCWISQTIGDNNYVYSCTP
jgi:hypothetical protein